MEDDELLMGTKTAADTDGDGVSDIQETLDGTDPDDAASVSRTVDATLDGDPGAELRPEVEQPAEAFARGSMTAPEGFEVERGLPGVDGVDVDTAVDRGVDLGADLLGGRSNLDPLGLGGRGGPSVGGGGGAAPGAELVGGQDMRLVSGDNLDFLDTMPPEPGAPPSPPPETGGTPDPLPPPPGAGEDLPPAPMDMPPPDPGETPAPAAEPTPAPEPAPEPAPAPAPADDDEDDTYADADTPAGGTLTGDDIERVLTTRGGNIDFDETGQAPLGEPANAPDLGLISNVDPDSAGSVGTTGGPGRPATAGPEVLPDHDGAGTDLAADLTADLTADPTASFEGPDAGMALDAPDQDGAMDEHAGMDDGFDG